MKTTTGHIRLSASDLSNHLACRHVTTLDLGVVRGELAEPAWAAPDLKVLQELGERFEKRFLEHLRELEAPGRGGKLELVDLSGKKSEAWLLEETLLLMQRGVDVIAQGALTDGDWFERLERSRQRRVA